MNNLSAMKRPGNSRNVRLSRSRLCQALVLAVMVVGWVEVAGPSESAARRLEQNAQTKKASSGVGKTYVCPMHPDVKSKKRGKCPKCGMDLRPARAETNAAGPADSSLMADNSTIESAGKLGNVNDAPDSLGLPRKMFIPDVEVLDQDGNRLHFYSDLIKGKTVAINFIFTNCTTICPPLAATFARVQRELGDKVGRDVHLISISVDPLTDTPERLKTWGAKFKAAAGWTLVTGDKQEITKLLSALDASVARRQDHSPTIIIGNAVTGEWTRTYGLAKPSQLVALILKAMAEGTHEALAKEPHQL